MRPGDPEEKGLLRPIGWLRHRPLINLWGPVFLWMAVIFFFSSRQTLPPPFSSSRYGSFFHSVAHFGEYAILAALLCRALVRQCQPERATAKPGEDELESDINWPSECRLLGLSFGIALLFALLDEVHQEFVPGRDAELADVALDVAGMAAALTVIRRWYQLRSEGSAKEQEGEEGG